MTNRSLRFAFLSSTALALLAPASRASGVASDEEWTSLDHEIAALEQTLATGPSGPRIGGFLRMRGAFSNDVDLEPAIPGSQDLAGFCLDNVRVQIEGSPRESWRYLVSIEAGHQGELDTFSGPGVVLLDAFVETPLCSNAWVQMGQFCSVFLWSACNDERNLLFLDRSFIAENWDGRDVGAQASATYGPFDAWFAVQNGFDGKETHDAYTARAAYRALGERGWCCEGSCFGGAERLVFGASVFEDRMMDHGTAVGFDALFVTGPFSAHAELVHYGVDMRPMPGVDPTDGVLIPEMMDPAGAETPWDATLAYAIVPDEWEVAVRGQFLDDEMDTSIYSLAVDRFIGGRNIKWTAEFDRSQSDDSDLEYGSFGVGLTAGI
jgi:hypothetical protein